jgi:hypothetical protein
MNFDWKCSVTSAILTVLVYLLMVKMFASDQKLTSVSSGEDIFKSDAFFVLVSAWIGYLVNANLFQGCGKTTGW